MLENSMRLQKIFFSKDNDVNEFKRNAICLILLGMVIGIIALETNQPQETKHETRH